MFIAKTFLFVEKTATKDDLEKINLFAKRELTAEEVYSFSIRLCDDQPDRDFERFTVSALQELSKLFIGKPGLFDHRWSAHEQTARIYDTSVEKCGNATCLMAKAYLLKTPENEALIASIDGGILKEVSVGCAIRRATCSICGESYGACDHRRGSEYDGEICYVELSEAVDAYEFSFVAVPAQPKAGVVKGQEPEIATAAEQPRNDKDVSASQKSGTPGSSHPTGAFDEVPATGGQGRPPLREEKVPSAMGENPTKTMSIEEAERAKARLRLEKLRYGG